MADFKVRVVKNIGRASKEEFGTPGTVHAVKYGTLVGDCADWNNNRMGIHSVEELNRIMESSITFNTVFELVDESEQCESIMYDAAKEIGQAVKTIKEGE